MDQENFKEFKQPMHPFQKEFGLYKTVNESQINIHFKQMIKRKKQVLKGKNFVHVKITDYRSQSPTVCDTPNDTNSIIKAQFLQHDHVPKKVVLLIEVCSKQELGT